MRRSRTETASDAVRMLVERGLPGAEQIPDADLIAMRRMCEREFAKKLRAWCDRSLLGEGEAG